jgi:hypothetical protein
VLPKWLSILEGSSHTLNTLSPVIFIDVGITVTDPSLILAVDIPLNAFVMLLGCDIVVKTKLVIVWVCPVVPLSLTISTCTSNGDLEKGDVIIISIEDYFKSIEEHSKAGFTRVYTHSTSPDEIKFIRDFCAKVLPYFNNLMS